MLNNAESRKPVEFGKLIELAYLVVILCVFVDQSVGTAIAMFMQGTQKERPLTQDLLANILPALGAKIERVIVNDLKRTTYFARLVLSAENESQHKKIIQIDARPSDCIATESSRSS